MKAWRSISWVILGINLLFLAAAVWNEDGVVKGFVILLPLWLLLNAGIGVLWLVMRKKDTIQGPAPPPPQPPRPDQSS